MLNKILKIMKQKIYLSFVYDENIYTLLGIDMTER